ncbi:Uncharacterized protein SCF082_LOCUS21832 [Durusdinium trenchii]|uniref:Uncharacterized protein n=1 Tax=Durusdinium trenchii TaxID=1381693 RepID=A0ABP0LDP0_9DINO
MLQSSLCTIHAWILDTSRFAQVLPPGQITERFAQPILCQGEHVLTTLAFNLSFSSLHPACQEEPSVPTAKQTAGPLWAPPKKPVPFQTEFRTHFGHWQHGKCIRFQPSRFVGPWERSDLRPVIRQQDPIDSI